MFVKITGLNGKTGRIDEAEITARYEPDMSRRTVTVQFVANNNLGMPWEFGPVVASMQVHPGKLYSTSFTDITRPGAAWWTGGSQRGAGKGQSLLQQDRVFPLRKAAAGCRRDQGHAAEVHRLPGWPRDVNTLTLAYTVFDVSQVAMK